MEEVILMIHWRSLFELCGISYWNLMLFVVNWGGSSEAGFFELRHWYSGLGFKSKFGINSFSNDASKRGLFQDLEVGIQPNHLPSRYGGQHVKPFAWKKIKKSLPKFTVDENSHKKQFHSCQINYIVQSARKRNFFLKLPH